MDMDMEITKRHKTLRGFGFIITSSLLLATKI